MKVRFIGTMPRKGYSGGRLLSLNMAEALAMSGASVDFLVDHIPGMYDEFRSFSKVRLIKTNFNNLSPWVDKSIDIVIVVPSMNFIPEHGEWTRHGIECQSRLVLLNFESPNWFNKLSPVKKSKDLWLGWDIVSEHADLILSISGEGNKYAKAYYNGCPKHCLFDFCYPGINTILADKAPISSQRERNIVLLTRVDHHKGYNALEALTHKDLAGYSVVVYLGVGKMPRWEEKSWNKKFDNVGMNLKVRSAITGIEKFTMLKRSSLLYFPTSFEGFGLPPLEAAYCLLPCACSGLPVLKEFGQDAFTYGDLSDTENMRRAVLEALHCGDRLIAEHKRIRKIAKMENWGNRLSKLLKRIV